MSITDIALKDFAVYPSFKVLSEVQKDLLKRNVKFVISMNGGNIGNIFDSFYVLKKTIELQNNKYTLGELKSDISFNIVKEDSSPLCLNAPADIIVVINKENLPLGIIADIKNQKALYQYEKIFEFLEEEIFLSDKNGCVLRINPEAEKIMDLKEENVIGKNVRDLVKNKVFSSSTTLEVLKKKKKVNHIQELKSGQSRLSTGVPVLDEQGQIVMVICTSKDVTDIIKLRKELDKQKYELERKNDQLNLLHEEVFAQVNFITRSKELDCIKETIKKVAPMDLTVLIQGESGVGKEVVAKTIHYLSKRKNSPFVKINCGLIPGNLLDSELFGYDFGAFTGASKGGKLGKIELANNGTLFLDEIGEMPFDLQVKLLEFLQDKEITHVGGTNKIKINTRVIAATNRDLLKMVEEKTFRKDLYYRLNVISLSIVPLRKRLDDLPILTEYFLDKFNKKYNMNKHLDPALMDVFLQYDWPGNIRELEHIMERLMVTCDHDIIQSEDFRSIIKVNTPGKGKVICTDLMPYKLAKRELERQLIGKAYEIHKSTYKAAKALEIDQSTVVKILKKYR